MTTENENQLDLDSYLDFDIDELEIVEGFLVPAPGVYTFEGVELKQEKRTVKEAKDSNAEIDVTVAVAKFKIIGVVELAKANTAQENIIGTELNIMMQLEHVTDGFFFKQQQSQMAMLTKPLAAAVGEKGFKGLVPHFPGMQFNGLIKNRKTADKVTKEITVRWQLDAPVIPA